MKFSFPWLAAGLGLLLILVLLQAGILKEAAERSLPLLTLLFISEFGFLVTAAGSIVAARSLTQKTSLKRDLPLALACAALAIAFLALGLMLWKSSVA